MNIQNSILSTEDFQNRLVEHSIKSRELIIISAYITEKALCWLVSIIPSECKVTLVARLSASDLLMNSSDLSAIELALKNKWQVSRLSKLHAKIYLIDDDNLFVGSANCTSNGLKLYGEGNIEATVELRATEAERTFIQKIISKSDVINLEILQKMKDYISDEENNSPTKQKDWPVDIFQPNNDLWISDLLWEIPSKLFSNSHDMELLNIQQTANNQEIMKALVHTKAFKWLTRLLEESEQRELYFGSLTAALHNELCDDPAPYRRAIKDLLSNLLSYCEMYATHLIKIDRPRHSQRVVLLDKQ